MIRQNNYLMKILLLGLSGLLLTACTGNSEASGSEELTESIEETELLEPAGTALNYELASYRDIDKVSIYSGIVCPDTVEYSYDSTLSFGSFSYLPGDTVSQGDILFSGNIEDIEEQKEAILSLNEDLSTDYDDYLTDYLVDLKKAKDKEYETANLNNLLNSYAPEDENSDAFRNWAKNTSFAESQYRYARMDREKLEQAALEKEELYKLEYAYNETRMKRLDEEIAEASGISTVTGEVVAAAYYMPGDQIASGSKIMAVGDTQDKEIMCDFISKSVIAKAKEVYALINGEKYAVQYQTMETDEYRRLLKQNDVVYTTFKIADPDNQISLGSYAVIVVVEETYKNVLSVPKGSVKKDDTGYYVYLVEGDETIYTTVQTGVSEGGFTEITYGLKEGDQVLFDSVMPKGDKTQTLESGCVSYDFSASGYLYYPAAEWIKNPSENGTCYLTQMCVERYEQVAKGQVIAKVEVVTDTIEINRIKRKIDRQNERLNRLLEEKKVTYNEDDLIYLDRAIRQKNRAIEDLQEQLDKLCEYAGEILLYAPYDGIVIDCVSLEEGELLSYKQNLVQLAPHGSSYLVVEDKEGLLAYGNEALITYKDGAGKAIEICGKVVSSSPNALSKELATGMALIRIPEEDSASLAELGSGLSNGYWNRNRFSVSATVRKMDGVVLVPKKAAKMIGNDNYVIVNDNGSKKYIKFVPGGSDQSNYWVAYGALTEGMQICLE